MKPVDRIPSTDQLQAIVDASTELLDQAGTLDLAEFKEAVERGDQWAISKALAIRTAAAAVIAKVGQAHQSIRAPQPPRAEGRQPWRLMGSHGWDNGVDAALKRLAEAIERIDSDWDMDSMPGPFTNRGMTPPIFDDQLRRCVEYGRKELARALGEVPDWFLCTLAEVRRAFGVNPRHSKFTDSLVRDGVMKRRAARSPIGNRKVEVMFTDPALHAEVRARIEQERRERRARARIG